MATTAPGTLTTADAERIAAELYGRSATAARLNGEFDDNFLLTVNGRAETILKVSRVGERRGFLELQDEALRWLARAPRATPYAFPRILPTTDGATIVAVPSHLPGAGRFARLLTRIEGSHLA